MSELPSDVATVEIRHQIYGVFQGGGARGIAYVGALAELRRRKCWFAGVAGTSAGAIIAAFIAADILPEQMKLLVPKALKAIKPVGWRGWHPARAFRGQAHYDTEPLRILIEEQLRSRIGINSTRENDVTFRELYEATRIELNIVVLAAPDTPIVLSRWSAPSCQVSYAVIASSAIPVAMTHQLLPAVSGLKNDSVIDGGAWANYPAFVFKDPSVRAYYGAPPIGGGKVVGFVLVEGDKKIQPLQTPRSQMWRAISSLLFAAVIGAIHVSLGWLADLLQKGEPDGFALLMSGLMALIVLAVVARSLLKPGAKFLGAVIAKLYRIPFIRGLSFLCLGIWQLVFLALLSAWTWQFKFQMAPLFLTGILASYALLVFSLGMFRYGEAVIASGIPAVRAALRATTGVAEWVGASGGDLVVRVPVRAGVKTTSFSLAPSVIKCAIGFAEKGTRDALIQLVKLLDGEEPPPDSHEGVRPDLMFLTPAAGSARSEELGRQQEKRNSLSHRWGTSVAQLGLSGLLLLWLHSVSDSMTPSAWDALTSPILVHPNAFVAVTILGTMSAMAFALGRLGQSIPLRRIGKRERSYATVNAIVFLLWWTVNWGALTQVLQTRGALSGGQAYLYHAYYVSRLWIWLPETDRFGPVAAPTWAQLGFVGGCLVVIGGLAWRLMNLEDGPAVSPDP